MSGHTPKKKRATWHDRRCHHGNEPVIRITYDFIHCEKPECWQEVLAHSGFLQRTPLRDAAPDLLKALHYLHPGRDRWRTPDDDGIKWIEAVIAQAEGR